MITYLSFSLFFSLVLFLSIHLSPLFSHLSLSPSSLSSLLSLSTLLSIYIHGQKFEIYERLFTLMINYMIIHNEYNPNTFQHKSNYVSLYWETQCLTVEYICNSIQLSLDCHVGIIGFVQQRKSKCHTGNEKHLKYLQIPIYINPPIIIAIHRNIKSLGCLLSKISFVEFGWWPSQFEFWII